MLRLSLAERAGAHEPSGGGLLSAGISDIPIGLSVAVLGIKFFHPVALLESKKCLPMRERAPNND